MQLVLRLLLCILPFASRGQSSSPTDGNRTDLLRRHASLRASQSTDFESYLAGLLARIDAEAPHPRVRLRGSPQNTSKHSERRRLGVNDGTMPAWKAKMIKERTTGGSESAKNIWHKWLKRTQEESVLARQSEGTRLGPGRTSGSSARKGKDRLPLIGDANNVLQECGAIPRAADRFKEAPSLGRLPHFYIYTDHEYGDYGELLSCYKDRFGVDAWEDERMWELGELGRRMRDVRMKSLLIR